MSEPRHLLVRASAGTGKTHRLTSRYLALLLSGADPGGILATTFTRKAAHEILDRVLQRLADAARDVKELEHLSEAVGRKVSGEECLDLLARLLRGMDRIRIETIDAFFAQLARLFALDIGLPAGWRIADEAEGDLVRSEAVADAVAEAGRLELLDLLRDLQRQAVGQSVHRALLDFAKIGREALLESRPGAWERIKPLAAVDPKALAAAVAALSSMKLPKTKSGKTAGSEKAHWVSNKRRLLECVEREDWPGVLEVGLALRICAGEAQFDKVTIEADQLEVLRPIVARALREVTENLARQNHASRAWLERHEESYQALCRQRGQLDFSDIPEALAPISGVGSGPSAATGRAGDVERRFDLEHRLDGRIDHLLLDEFQDTAPVQWRVLRPIADAILADASGEKSFFCVGDAKQSIYGWRAAEPRLLGALEGKRPNLAGEELPKSYRSSRAVLETVNEVFAKISQNRAFTDGKGNERTAAIQAAREFEGLFRNHESAWKRGEEPPGSVCVLRARASDEKGTEYVPTLKLVVERVQGILDDAPLAKVGILMRRRKWIPALIQRLREAGIPASDQGGNPLTDSVAVLHALSLLHLADHPGDLAAAFHVATSPLGSRVGRSAGKRGERSASADSESPTGKSGTADSESPVGRSGNADSESPVDKSVAAESESPTDRSVERSISVDRSIGSRVDSSREAAVEPSTDTHTRLGPSDFMDIEIARSRAASIAREVRRSLAESGYGGWLASIRPKEGDGYSAWDIERFGQLIDLALAWESRAGSRPGAFVEHVRKTKVEDPSAEQVRVITVHGAKGLEFDAVILPELDGRLAQREDRLLTRRPDPEGEIEVVTHGLKKEIAAAHAGLERVRVDVARRRMVEELCVLYVAMTRARHRLDLIVKAREKEGGGLTHAAILRGALGVSAAGAEGVAWTQAESTEEWFRPEIARAVGVSGFVTGARGSVHDAESPAKRDVESEEERDATLDGERDAERDNERKVERGADMKARPEAARKAEKDARRVAAMRPGKRLRLAPSLRTRSLPGRSPSRAKDVGSVRASELLLPHDAITARGRIIHRLLEEVEWIETFDRSDEELMAIGRRIEPDEGLVASALAEFRAALARPVTREVLSRPAGEVEVWRERRFAVVMPGRDGKPTLWNGAFDRVVIRREKGQAVSAQMVDFKTDRVERNRLIERADGYASQVGVYRKAIGAMTGLNQDEVGARLLFLSRDTAINA